MGKPMSDFTRSPCTIAGLCLRVSFDIRGYDSSTGSLYRDSLRLALALTDPGLSYVPQALLEHNAKVYLATRNKEKAAAALAELKEATGKDALFLELDLASLASVRRAAAEFLGDMGKGYGGIRLDHANLDKNSPRGQPSSSPPKQPYRATRRY